MVFRDAKVLQSLAFLWPLSLPTARPSPNLCPLFPGTLLRALAFYFQEEIRAFRVLTLHLWGGGWGEPPLCSLCLISAKKSH